ncbi:ladderlectin-like protein, partial [Leptotrombidium deliense]
MTSRITCTAILLFALINVIAGDFTCPNSKWVKHGNKCYLYERYNRDFFRMKSYCESLGATMLAIESQEENDFIQSVFTRTTAYLGATRVPGTDKWQWPNGKIMEYSNWNPGEPNNWRGNENCIQFYNNIGYPGKWNDYGCYKGEYTFCQIEFNT